MVNFTYFKQKFSELMFKLRRMKNMKADLTLQVAIEKAEEAHKKTGVRYWILPTPEGQLAVMNWSEARQWRDMGILPKQLKIGGLYNLAFYWTAASSKTTSKMHGWSLPKPHVNYEMYYRWWKMTHK